MPDAMRGMISTFGGFVGLMGIEHGIGEILQGNQAPEHWMILSWPESPFFKILSGEPAMTLVPNLLVTGILAVLFSLAYFVTAVWWVERRHGATALLLLCPLMLVAGGGIFPPVLGLLIALAATRLRARRPARWLARIPAGLQTALKNAWPWFFGACLASWLGMFPGVPVMAYFFGLSHDGLIFALLAGMFVFLGLSGLAGSLVDLPREPRPA